LLWGAVLATHGIEAEVRDAGNAFLVATSGVGAARLARLYFLYGSPLLEGDERIINHKLAEAVKLGAEGLDIRWEGLRLTKSRVAADLIISEAGVAVKYTVYLRIHDIRLQFQSTDRSRVELAARLLKQAGVSADVKKEGGRDRWYVHAYTDMLAAGREELRNALAEIIRESIARGWVETRKAEGWLVKLEKGLTLKKGWPRYNVMLKNGTLMVRFGSTNPASIERETQRLRGLGLVEGVYFSVRMPEGGGRGYVYILKEGLKHAAWLSMYGSEEQRKLAAEFVEYILKRAKEAGKDVYEKARKIVEKVKARGSLRLADVRRAEVEVKGRTYVVKVVGLSAKLEESQSGKLLLRIKITAEVDGVLREYVITYGRYGKLNAALGFAVARADAPGGREADAERLAAVIKALTGKKPRIRRKSDGTIDVVCGREHLDGFARYAELAETIEKWLEETSRR